ncbi:MAG TPA: hypothetical protein VGO32_03920 [Candidatus Limnocylindria bacterium]|nr:hypothetical protein [Candidatus Limnocylindria bacterium]
MTAPRKPASPKAASAKTAPVKTTPAKAAPTGDDLTAAILRYLRRVPNEERPLDPLAEELGMDPAALQLAVERLHWRRYLIAPFVEPGRAGGAKLTAVGLHWLIAREGGKPRDTPVAFQPARRRVRTQDEAARLPRATVYGVRGAATSTSAAPER